MDSSKLLPISVALAGLGILVIAVSQAKKDKNGNAYLNQGMITESFNAKEIAAVLYNAMKKSISLIRRNVKPFSQHLPE